MKPNASAYENEHNRPETLSWPTAFASTPVCKGWPKLSVHVSVAMC